LDNNKNSKDIKKESVPRISEKQLEIKSLDESKALTAKTTRAISIVLVILLSLFLITYLVNRDFLPTAIFIFSICITLMLITVPIYITIKSWKYDKSFVQTPEEKAERKAVVEASYKHASPLQKCISKIIEYNLVWLILSFIIEIVMNRSLGLVNILGSGSIVVYVLTNEALNIKYGLLKNTNKSIIKGITLAILVGLILYALINL